MRPGDIKTNLTISSKGDLLPPHKKGRVLVAMSGGVDSSVAAALLLQQGYDVVGVTMQVWDYTQNTCETQEGYGTCCSSLDVDDARAVADHLNIPFYVINCEAKFKSTVIDDFVQKYLKGETPIPCVNCNTYLKFDHLFKKMKQLDCRHLATGHYAQIQKSPITNKQSIFTSSDDWKDQTYFLFILNHQVIPHLLFPVGNWTKPQLRHYAEELGLPVAKKKDSTGICFIGKKPYTRFIENQTPKAHLKPGVFKLYPTGEILGSHPGIHHFTYGQRKGMGISHPQPLYVRQIDSNDHTVWLCEEPDLYQERMIVRGLNWLDEVHEGEKFRVKIRFQHKGATAKWKSCTEGIQVHFNEPQRAITPGQAAVFYRGNQLVGGGWIQ